VHHQKRTTEEYIILKISGAYSLCILPFFFIRAFDSDWLIAALDLLAAGTSAGLFIYVYRSRKIQFARWALAILFSSLVFFTVLLKGSQQLVWMYPASIGISYLLLPKMAASLNVLVALALGALTWNELDSLSAAQFAISMLITLMFSYVFADSMHKQQRRLLTWSSQDPLTGVGNRRAMEEKLLEIVALRRRNNNISAALILIDLDKFKSINDQHGHVIGDKILIHFVQIINQRLRNTDKVYRFGGEEFLIIADDTDADSVSILAEQLREAVDIAIFPAQLHVTISLGLAQYHDGETSSEWLGRADKAMYRAKAGGRNLCYLAPRENGSNLTNCKNNAAII
jgi:diguanylate cyclase